MSSAETLARTPDGSVRVRNTTLRDIPGIRALSLRIYPNVPPWQEAEIREHLRVFPTGQLVAVEEARRHATDALVVGMAASLIVRWDDYDFEQSWREFTADGTFRNHDPEGAILYGAEIMVHPDHRRRGIGSAIYDARERLVRRLGLRAIRAGARLSGYGGAAEEMGPETYLRRVVAGELADPTLSFQLMRGFRPLALVEDYLRRDPASRGWAVLVEWRNPDLEERDG